MNYSFLPLEAVLLLSTKFEKAQGDLGEILRNHTPAESNFLKAHFHFSAAPSKLEGIPGNFWLTFSAQPSQGK